MKERSDIEEKYKWNLKDIYRSKKDFDCDFEELKNLGKKVEAYKGKLNHADTMLAYLQLDDRLDYLGGKLGLYTFLKRDEDISNSKNIELANTVSLHLNKIAQASAFVEPEILKLNDIYVNQILNDPRFKDYRHGLENIIRSKAHILDDKTEELLSKIGDFAGGYSDVYDNMESVDIVYKPFKFKGKTYEVTQGNYSVLRESKYREIRKQAYESMYNGFKDYANTLATTYIYNVKTDWFFTKERNFDSCLQAEFDSKNLTTKVYDTLLKNVEKNLKLAHDYFGILKEQSKLKDFTTYDISMPLAKLDKTFSVEDSKKIVLDSLSVLGEDYVAILKEALSGGWIDFYETKGKATGGYKVSVYGVHPYILLNYQPNYRNLSTLAHELGHACHSFYGYKNNPISTADESLFVSEIASTTNEILLLKYMYAHAKTKQEKIFYLSKFIDDFYATVFVQTMYSKFEEYAHSVVEKDESLSKDLLCDYYGKLVETFQGKNVVPQNLSKYSWLRIPHFYRCYYVYKYATSYAVATFVANKILNHEDDMLNKYKKFLSAGGTDYPGNVLKLIGVDLENDHVYDIAFQELKWGITELKKLLTPTTK